MNMYCENCYLTPCFTGFEKDQRNRSYSKEGRSRVSLANVQDRKLNFVRDLFNIFWRFCIQILTSPSFSEQRILLKKCASTSMCSKLIAYNKDFFSDMVVDAVMCLDRLMPLNMIGRC